MDIPWKIELRHDYPKPEVTYRAEPKRSWSKWTVWVTVRDPSAWEFITKYLKHEVFAASRSGRGVGTLRVFTTASQLCKVMKYNNISYEKEAVR
jgi:hypothetical protein